MIFVKYQIVSLSKATFYSPNKTFHWSISETFLKIMNSHNAIAINLWSPKQDKYIKQKGNKILKIKSQPEIMLAFFCVILNAISCILHSAPELTFLGEWKYTTFPILQLLGSFVDISWKTEI